MGDQEKKQREELEIIWDGRNLDWVKPRTCREYLRGVGLKYLLNPYFEEGFEKLIREYRPKKHYPIGLIMPCSYGKPYSNSYIHYMIRRNIADLIRNGVVHEIIVTNAGVVPRELDEYWPYVAYDWNPIYETPEIKEWYTRVLEKRLGRYITTFQKYYDRFVAYLRWNSDSWRAVKRVSEKLGVEIPNLVPKNVPEQEIMEASLDGLYEDEDIVLITKSSLRRLREKLLEILGKT